MITLVRLITSFLVLIFSLFIFRIPAFASFSIMAKEIQLAAETGQFIQIIEEHEEALIDRQVQSYVQPFRIAEEAIQFAAVIQNELKRYHSDVLQQLNIRFYLVKASANIAGLTLTKTNQSSCLIYLAQENNLSIQQIKQTIHHEIFHCYDQKDSIERWAKRFAPANHILDVWNTISNERITIDYAAEERAEYFASIVMQNSRQLELDPSFELKQQVLLSDIYTLIRDPKAFPSLRTFFIRHWQDGRIISIEEVTFSSSLVRTYEFDFRTSSCIITNYLTNTRTILIMS